MTDSHLVESSSTESDLPKVDHTVDTLRGDLAHAQERDRETRDVIDSTARERKKSFFLTLKDALFNKKTGAVLMGVLTGVVGTLIVNPLYRPLANAIVGGLTGVITPILSAIGINRAASYIGPLGGDAAANLLDASGAAFKPLADVAGSVFPNGVGKVTTTFR